MGGSPRGTPAAMTTGNQMTKPSNITHATTDAASIIRTARDAATEPYAHIPAQSSPKAIAVTAVPSPALAGWQRRTTTAAPREPPVALGYPALPLSAAL